MLAFALLGFREQGAAMQRRQRGFPPRPRCIKTGAEKKKKGTEKNPVYLLAMKNAVK
ncbi:hypothetical protein [Moorena sp. SIO2C4]|uniref:hypothetical protein n=1 Tax=Moorena sp. SIO2C4 TaxID=2607824 RepID=UPI0013C0D259|nr:hypothetical protein [Moorena sp. SIO2C4]NEQ17132.1 hypothetical protein [Moorena sp. SIO3E2]NES44640.1 hypothetical protein [Moorena sp. SIO2C4]